MSHSSQPDHKLHDGYMDVPAHGHGSEDRYEVQIARSWAPYDHRQLCSPNNDNKGTGGCCAASMGDNGTPFRSLTVLQKSTSSKREPSWMIPWHIARRYYQGPCTICLLAQGLLSLPWLHSAECPAALRQAQPPAPVLRHARTTCPHSHTTLKSPKNDSSSGPCVA